MSYTFQFLTLPFIESENFSIDWVYNILNHTTLRTVKQIMHEEELPEPEPAVEAPVADPEPPPIPSTASKSRSRSQKTARERSAPKESGEEAFHALLND